MSLKSMTGFGRGESSAGGVRIEVEVGSVNRRQLDVRVSIPREYAVLEPRLCERVHEYLSRGSVTVSVRKTLAAVVAGERLAIDQALAAEYLRVLRGTAAALKLKDDLTARSLLQLPDLVRSRSPSDEPAKIWPLLRAAADMALGRLSDMRAREGRTLEKDMARRFSGLRRRLGHIRQQAPRVAVRYRAALHRRLAEAKVDVELDGGALAREIALFADRCDISEEIVRLDSHFQQAGELMAAAAPAGRSLDFLCQEMFREINTIGSKAGDARISRDVIEFKAILEGLREQVQNVE